MANFLKIILRNDIELFDIHFKKSRRFGAARSGTAIPNTARPAPASKTLRGIPTLVGMPIGICGDLNVY